MKKHGETGDLAEVGALRMYVIIADQSDAKAIQALQKYERKFLNKVAVDPPFRIMEGFLTNPKRPNSTVKVKFLMWKIVQMN